MLRAVDNSNSLTWLFVQEQMAQHVRILVGALLPLWWISFWNCLYSGFTLALIDVASGAWNLPLTSFFPYTTFQTNFKFYLVDINTAALFHQYHFVCGWHLNFIRKFVRWFVYRAQTLHMFLKKIFWLINFSLIPDWRNVLLSTGNASCSVAGVTWHQFYFLLNHIIRESLFAFCVDQLLIFIWMVRFEIEFIAETSWWFFLRAADYFRPVSANTTKAKWRSLKFVVFVCQLFLSC